MCKKAIDRVNVRRMALVIEKKIMEIGDAWVQSKVDDTAFDRLKYALQADTNLDLDVKVERIALEHGQRVEITVTTPDGPLKGALEVVFERTPLPGIGAFDVHVKAELVFQVFAESKEDADRIARTWVEGVQLQHDNPRINAAVADVRTTIEKLDLEEVFKDE